MNGKRNKGCNGMRGVEKKKRKKVLIIIIINFLMCDQILGLWFISFSRILGGFSILYLVFIMLFFPITIPLNRNTKL